VTTNAGMTQAGPAADSVLGARMMPLERPQAAVRPQRRCSHHIEISADRWPDHVRLSDIEPLFICTACDKRGAEVRPKFSNARMGTG
jgi:hypothetical protein